MKKITFRQYVGAEKHHYDQLEDCHCDMREWKPIETAPKDGAIVDLWHKTLGRMTETWWDGCWVCIEEGDNAFSHWMPLPEPPEVTP